MNKQPNRAKVLADAFIEATRKAEEERDFNAQAARVAAIAKPEIDKILAQYKAQAGDDLEVECPYCHNTFAVDQRPDTETSETGQDDPDNEQDNAATWDNRRRIDHLARSLSAASRKGSSQR